MRRIWDYAEPVKIDEVDCLTLSPEHQLIYLCQHAFTHVFDKLILLSDIEQVIRHYKDRLDWELIKQESGKWGFAYIVYHTLCFTSQTLKFEVPSLKGLKPGRFGLFEKLAFSFMRKGKHNYTLSCLVYLGLQKGLFNKLRFIARMVFPSSHVMANNCALPSALITPAHYFRRLLNFPAYFRSYSYR